MRRFWLFNPYPIGTSGNGNRPKFWMRLLPSIRIHHICREDRDRHLHDHPWEARTIVLRGWYSERRLSVLPSGRTWIRYHIRLEGDTAPLKMGMYHSITEVPPEGVWTLFITWKYQGTWGFLVDGRKVPYREYLNASPTRKDLQS